jgi:hypothetical protein
MKTHATTSVLGLLLSLAASWFATTAGAGEIPAAQAGLWFCQSIQSSPTTTLYASDVFGGTFDGSEVKSAFQNALKTQHGVTVQVSCSMAYDTQGIREKIEGEHQRWFTQIRNGGGTVVETHWTFAPASERFAYQCFGGAQHMNGTARVSTYLYTDPLEMAGAQQDKLGLAWEAYLAELHPGWLFAGAEGCTRLPNDPTQRQAVIDSNAERWKALKAEMVRVNWTFAPVQASADDNVPSVFCQALRSDNKQWYVTPVFPAATAAEGTAAMNAWRTYLKGVKDPDGNIVAESYLDGCDGPGPAKAMKKQKAARDEQIRDGGGRVVEVAWTFGGATNPTSAGAVAPVPTSPGAPTGSAAQVLANAQQTTAPNAGGATAQQTAAPVAGSQSYYQCSMGALGANYLTPGFSSTKDLATIKADWSTYIRKAHPVQGVAHTNCMETTPKSAAAGLAGPGFKREDWTD